MEDATSLVLRAKDGDVHAFAGLYAQIYKDLYRFAVCTLQNLHDAEDAVSETVLDAFAQIGSLRKPESFKSWMFAILSVKCRPKWLKIHTFTVLKLIQSADVSQNSFIPMLIFRLQALSIPTFRTAHLMWLSATCRLAI